MTSTLTSAPVCVEQPSHLNHPPPAEKPLRVCVLGPLYAIQKIFPEVNWPAEISPDRSFLVEAGTHPSNLVFSTIYGCGPDKSRSDDFVFKSAACNRLNRSAPTLDGVDFEAIFDHLVPSDDNNPEVLQINIVDPEEQKSNDRYLKILINPEELKYTFIAVPRCCQVRVGSTDRARVNNLP